MDEFLLVPSFGSLPSVASAQESRSCLRPCCSVEEYFVFQIPQNGAEAHAGMSYHPQGRVTSAAKAAADAERTEYREQSGPSRLEGGKDPSAAGARHPPYPASIWRRYFYLGPQRWTDCRDVKRLNMHGCSRQPLISAGQVHVLIASRSVAFRSASCVEFALARLVPLISLASLPRQSSSFTQPIWHLPDSPS